MRLALLVCVLLMGCSAEADKPRVARIDRKAAAELAVAKTPVPRTYRMDGNELKVIEVPVKDSSGFLDMHRCFVWRDQEFRTATLSCGQEPMPLLSQPGPRD